MLICLGLYDPKPQLYIQKSQLRWVSTRAQRKYMVYLRTALMTSGMTPVAQKLCQCTPHATKKIVQ